MNSKIASPGKLTSIDDQFILEHGHPVEGHSYSLKRWEATSKTDGEVYQLCLFKKTGQELDRDLRRILHELVRRIRGVLVDSNAREVLVEILDVIEDNDEIGLRFADKGTPLYQIPIAARARLFSRLRTTKGRVRAWEQILRLAQAMGFLHTADIVHGNICENAVFVDGRDVPVFRLGGYENAVHIGSLGKNSTQLLKQGSIVSIRKDWQDLGYLAESLLNADRSDGVVLIPSERKLLDRLKNPPMFSSLESRSLAVEIDSLCKELERTGSSGQSELIIVPSKELLRKDLRQLAPSWLPVPTESKLIELLKEDIGGCAPLMWRLPGDPLNSLLIFTNRTTYRLEPDSKDDRVGRIVECRPRRSSDPTFQAKKIEIEIRLCKNTYDAKERIRRVGGGILPWSEINNEESNTEGNEILPQWHALNLIEVFSLVASRLRHYPVEIIETTEAGVIQLVSRPDSLRDRWRSKLGQTTAAEGLNRELKFDDGRTDWILATSDALSLGSSPLMLSLSSISDKDGRQVFTFDFEGPIPDSTYVILRPRPDRGQENVIRRRLRSIAEARANHDLLLALDNPNSVGLDKNIAKVASPGVPPSDMDDSKNDAWSKIKEGNSIDLVVGPPGVGKSYLVSRLVGSILENAPYSKILISAQNHDALIEMQRGLVSYFVNKSHLLFRVEKSGEKTEETELRQATISTLSDTLKRDVSPILKTHRNDILHAVSSSVNKTDEKTEAMLRDTENLLLRSADITLATANSFIIEELRDDGERFDWVIVEEAARASGPELIGVLMLGSRRLLIGDHHQLAPFDAERRAHFYQTDVASALLEDAIKSIKAVPDLPDVLIASLEELTKDEILFQDVVATAARLEQPFREIAEREEERDKYLENGPVSILREQSRMHPEICKLVSESFYEGRLTSSKRVMDREAAIAAESSTLASPLIILDLPALSVTKKRNFEEKIGTSRQNRTEAKAVVNILSKFSPTPGRKRTLAILTPFTAQKNLLEREISKITDPQTGTISGLVSSKDNGQFVHTVDGFQGGEADLVIVSLVRNNDLVGPRALGFLSDRRRMNVLLSRARDKLILVTSLRFLKNTVEGHDPDGLRYGRLGFLSEILNTIDEFKAKGTCSIVPCDDEGALFQ